jgi:hypothetical protein
LARLAKKEEWRDEKKQHPFAEKDKTGGRRSRTAWNVRQGDCRLAAHILRYTAFDGPWRVSTIRMRRPPRSKWTNPSIKA